MASTVKEIRTLRLDLRGIDLSDTQKIVEWRSEPDVFKYFKAPHKITAEEHIAWFNNYYLNNPLRWDWMCIERSTGNRIGVFGLAKSADNTEVNYLLAPEAQHKGYAAEAVRAIIDYAISELHSRAIIAEIHIANQASISFASCLGFKAGAVDGNFCTYSLELDDWF